MIIYGCKRGRSLASSNLFNIYNGTRRRLWDLCTPGAPSCPHSLLNRLVGMSLWLEESIFPDFICSPNVCVHLLPDLEGHYREPGPLWLRLPSKSSIILVGDCSCEELGSLPSRGWPPLWAWEEEEQLYQFL